MSKKKLMKLSGVLGVPAKTLSQENVFNGFISIDSELYLDPRLIKKASTEELKESYSNFRKYFQKIILLLRKSEKSDDIFFRNAVSFLTFKEPDFLSLGYATEGNSGRGIGLKLAHNLATTAQAIINAGIEDPEIFEIIGLFEDDIGADRISDMIGRIILPDLAKYSENLARKLKLETRMAKVADLEFLLPINKKSKAPLILLPQEILNDLPIAHDKSDIDRVVMHNQELRNQINSMIGDEWTKASVDLRKKELKKLLLENPDALRELIELYKLKEVSPYDFSKDPLGEFLWLEIAEEYSSRFPIDFEAKNKVTSENIFEIVLVICEQFKKLVERNGLCLVFWDGDNCKHERFAQRLFFAIATIYCDANELDISPEANAGRGPVDFKMSKGKAKVNVEIKYTTNTLKHAYETQLPIYNDAEGTSYCILLAIRNSESINAFESLEKRRQKDIEDGKRVPEIMLVDGRKQLSASKSKEKKL